MQVTKSRNILKKINSIFDNMIEDRDAISPLEQELLKSYVIQFYDAIVSDEAGDTSYIPVAKSAPKQSTPPVAEVTEPIVRTPEPEVTKTDLNATAKPEASVDPVKEPTPTPVGKPVEKGEDLLASIFAEIEKEQSNSHIGERLISDLKKTMGLNDKLLYANKLFDGNQSQLLDTLEQLNQATDLETIKPQLNGLAQKNNWLADDKRKPVTEFVRLVVRKFNTVS